MNLLVMRTRLRKRVGNPDIVDVPDDDLTEHINQAYRDIADRFRFHKARKLCTFPTVSGTKDYGLPTDCSAVYHVRDKTTGMKLPKVDTRDDADQESVDSDVQGIPQGYIRYRNFVRFEPTPDGVYTIEMFYKAGIVDLAADADIPILPDAWHEGILKLARHYFYDAKPDVPKAQYALAIYQSWLSTKPVEVDEEKRDLDKGVRLPTLTRGNRGRYSSDVDAWERQ